LLIFELILTSFKLSIVFGGSCGSTENWLEPKTAPPAVKCSVSNSAFQYTYFFYFDIEKQNSEQKPNYIPSTFIQSPTLSVAFSLYLLPSPFS